MKKLKLLIPILIIAIGIGIVLYDTANTTVEDVIYQQAGIDNTSPVKTMIGEVKDGDVSLYLYLTKDNRFGYATIKTNDSLFSKYSLCSVENIDAKLLLNSDNIVRHYDKQQLDFTYGIIVEPKDDSFIYETQEYRLDTFEFQDITVGAFINDNIKAV